MDPRPWNIALLLLLLVSASPASAADAGADAPCRPIDGIQALLAPGQHVVLGELHGTAESPAFALDLVCHALAAGRSITLGLELLQEDQERLDAYLRSEGRPADRDALYSPFWRKDYQDGRTSRAMADLIEEMRRLHKAGEPVRVAFIDRPQRGVSRDANMARRMAMAHREAPEDMLIALTGNIHSRAVAGTRWNSAHEPMGYLLARSLPDARVITLDASHTGGSAWLCLSGEPCQVQKLGGRGKGERPSVSFGESPGENGHHGRYFVGAISASPPAAVKAGPRQTSK